MSGVLLVPGEGDPWRLLMSSPPIGKMHPPVAERNGAGVWEPDPYWDADAPRAIILVWEGNTLFEGFDRVVRALIAREELRCAPRMACFGAAPTGYLWEQNCALPGREEWSLSVARYGGDADHTQRGYHATGTGLDGGLALFATHRWRRHAPTLGALAQPREAAFYSAWALAAVCQDRGLGTLCAIP